MGIAHHLGCAVAVTASADHEVVDRRRIELIEPGMSTAPIHHEGKPLDDTAAAALVAKVRASSSRATSASLDELATAISQPIVAMSLRAWPVDFPDDIVVLRRAPYESRADSVMYRQVLAELARARGWAVHLYDGKDVESQAVSVLGERADEALRGPRATLGPPWGEGPSDGARRDDHGGLNVDEEFVRPQRIRPRPSWQCGPPQCSTILPSRMRRIAVPLISTGSPEGGTS